MKFPLRFAINLPIQIVPFAGWFFSLLPIEITEERLQLFSSPFIDKRKIIRLYIQNVH